MKSIIALFICVLSMFPFSGIRYDTGVIASRTYVEDGDYMITTIETSDGNLWDVINYTAPIGYEVIIQFSTMGTENIYDDEVDMIICFSAID